MLAIAAGLGYSETAFLVPRDDGAIAIRYFSPQAEVPFCGHATIAAGVAWAEAHGPGPIALDTASGRVDVDIQVHDGALRATLTSVSPRTAELIAADLDDLLAALRWDADRSPP